MDEDVVRELAALPRMTVGQLRRRWEEVHGEPARSFNRQHLVKRIAWRIQALREGGLPERARRRAEELARDADIRIRAPRASNSPPPGAPIQQATLHLDGARQSGAPVPGMVLRREYKDRVLLVRVLPKGFEFEGEIYRSLTAIAKKVTGANWSGQHFFGLPRSRTATREEAA